MGSTLHAWGGRTDEVRNGGTNQLRKVSEVNRSAPLEIEDATPANVALDINELCGIVDDSSALRRDHKGEQ
jgi:hypothetical protein